MDALKDEKFQKAVWSSRIPVKIDIAIEDLTDKEPPNSLYFLIPRIGYLSIIIQDLKKIFDTYIPINSGIEDIWLEANKIPLKWHIPFGIMIDSIMPKDFILPVNIIAHFRRFPEVNLIKYKGKDSLKFSFMNSLKEANTIMYGTSSEVLNMPTNETMKLINIAFNNDVKMFNEYKEINSKLVDENLDKIKKFPIKLIFGQTEIMLNKPYPYNDITENWTLENYLKDALNDQIYETIYDNCRVVIHGMEIDLNIPIAFLCVNFSYMDNYLYITFASKK